MSDTLINRLYSNTQRPVENQSAEQLSQQANERLQQRNKNVDTAQETRRNTPVAEAEKQLKAYDTVSTSVTRQAAPEIAPIESEQAAQEQVEATKKMLFADIFGAQNSQVHNAQLLQSQLLSMNAKDLIQ